MVQLRFRGVRGTGVQSDIAIDDVTVLCKGNVGSFGTCKCMTGYVNEHYVMTLSPCPYDPIKCMAGYVDEHYAQYHFAGLTTFSVVWRSVIYQVSFSIWKKIP